MEGGNIDSRTLKATKEGQELACYKTNVDCKLIWVQVYE